MEEKCQYFMIFSWAWPTQYPIFWLSQTFFRLISMDIRFKLAKPGMKTKNY